MILVSSRSFNKQFLGCEATQKRNGLRQRNVCVDSSLFISSEGKRENKKISSIKLSLPGHLLLGECDDFSARLGSPFLPRTNCAILRACWVCGTTVATISRGRFAPLIVDGWWLASEKDKISLEYSWLRP